MDSLNFTLFVGSYDNDRGAGTYAGIFSSAALCKQALTKKYFQTETGYLFVQDKMDTPIEVYQENEVNENLQVDLKDMPEFKTFQIDRETCILVSCVCYAGSFVYFCTSEKKWKDEVWCGKCQFKGIKIPFNTIVEIPNEINMYCDNCGA